MDQLLMNNPVTKRLLLGLGGAFIIAVNKKFGLNLSEVELGIMAGLLATMITGSNWKEAQIAKAEAAASVTTSKEAVAVLKEVAK